MLLQVKATLAKPNAKLPTWGSPDAAGLDLYAALSEEQMPFVTINPGETVLISVGIKTSFTPGYAAFLYARSGIATKRHLAPANKVGVVDADYRGEWFVPMHNHSNEPQIIEDGERIAQVIFQEVEHPQIVLVESLDSTERGDGGFGSTGVK